MRAGRRALAIASLLLAALGGDRAVASPFQCSARGGPEWREYRSEHVRLRTDLPDDEAREMVRELELARAAVLSVLFARPQPIPSVVQAIAFARRDDYEAMSPPATRAYYTTLDGLTPTVVLPGTLGSRTRPTLIHEMTHHLSSFPLLRRPMWLSEGLAVYMESVGSTNVQTRMTVGAVPEGRRVLREVDESVPNPFQRTRPGRIPVTKLLRWRSVDPSWSKDLAARYYESSWLLVHYLVNRRAEALGDLFRRLGQAEDPALAWKGAFPQWDPSTPGAVDGLEGELDEYARHGRVRFRVLELQVSPTITERPVPSSEVHALRARLLPHGGEKRREVLRAEIDEALAEDPEAVAPVVVLAALDPGAGLLPLARAATQAHPADWRAWTLLGDVLPATARAERLAARRRAVEVGPDEPVALQRLAWDLATANLAKEAAPHALHLARIAPYSPVASETLARVAMRLGLCGDAVRAQQRALDTLPDSAPAAIRDAAERRLAGYQEACTPAGTPSRRPPAEETPSPPESMPPEK